jgi:hypothetical protein
MFSIEQILGLKPMNQKDLVAVPMATMFTATPDPTAFTDIYDEAGIGGNNSLCPYGALSPLSASFLFKQPTVSACILSQCWFTSYRQYQPQPNAESCYLAK